MGKQTMLPAMANVARLSALKYSSKPREAVAHLPARHSRGRGEVTDIRTAFRTDYEHQV